MSKTKPFWKWAPFDHVEMTKTVTLDEPVWGNGCDVRGCLNSSKFWHRLDDGSHREVCIEHAMTNLPVVDDTVESRSRYSK